MREPGAGGGQEAGAPLLHDAHVACRREAMTVPDLNAKAVADYEREHGPMTDEQRQMVR
jgi:hypothetical protein